MHAKYGPNPSYGDYVFSRWLTKTSPTHTDTRIQHITKTSSKQHEYITKTSPTHRQHFTITSPKHHQHIAKALPTHYQHITGTSLEHHRNIATDGTKLFVTEPKLVVVDCDCTPAPAQPPVHYTHLQAHETSLHLVCHLLL